MKKKKIAVTKNMKLGEIVKKYPKSAEIMMKYGLHCIGCFVSQYETIEQGALAHGMDKKTMNKMLEEINKKI